MATPLALKVDVDTLRGTLAGVPRLAASFGRHGAGASFLFSLGPDHTGRALKRVFRPGFLQKVGRTSVVEHYGIRTLLYGVLLPGPDIGRRAAAQMRAVRDAGFEVGVHCWDHVKWQDGVRTADAAWTDAELDRALRRFAEVFGTPPRVHGAAGWQMNRHALERLAAAGVVVSSDCRGSTPFRAQWDGAPLSLLQLPTTLPTFDELIGVDGLDAAGAAERLLSLTATPPASGHVFTLHAELEGMKLLPQLERLLAGWTAQGYELVSLSELYARLEPARLPTHALAWGSVAGRSGELLVQGASAAP